MATEFEAIPLPESPSGEFVYMVDVDVFHYFSWSIGVLEYWSAGPKTHQVFPLLQYSSTPLLLAGYESSKMICEYFH